MRLRRDREDVFELVLRVVGFFATGFFGAGVGGFTGILAAVPAGGKVPGAVASTALGRATIGLGAVDVGSLGNCPVGTRST